ncbi:MAG: hypothetical protein K2W95_33710 [Candidatus Obscuribacterales bacterium]|nr:hypothetical protein [Candidatus Obscuribacterales bacterium]
MKLIMPPGAIKIALPEFPDDAALMSDDLISQLIRTAVSRRSRSRRRGLTGGRIPDGSIVIDAPDLPQPNNYSCALAAASIARMYGLGPDSMDEFMRQMKTTKNGTHCYNIARYLTKLGLDATVERDMTREYLMSLLDQRIASILAIQAWAEDPSVYDDPDKNDDGHYVAAIGYHSKAPRKFRKGMKLATAPRQKPGAHPGEFFYFMDPSILCRRGYLSWTDLDKRWHDNEGTTKKPRITRHMGIVIRPNGHEPVHDTIAEPIR